jgi:TAP-like protein
MYGPESWPSLADLLDATADAVFGEPASAASVGGLRADLLRQLGKDDEPEQPYNNGVEAYYGNQCADTEYPRSLGLFRAFDAFARAGSAFGPYWWWFNAPCARWPVNQDRFTGPWNVSTSAPVLVVGNFFDPATDYAGAEAATSLLQGSRLLSYAGWGHTAYGINQCTTDFVDAYLLDGALPPEGTVCEANPSPFLSTAARTAEPAVTRVGLPPEWVLNR